MYAFNVDPMIDIMYCIIQILRYVEKQYRIIILKCISFNMFYYRFKKNDI